MLVVSRQTYELVNLNNPNKTKILYPGILTDVPEEYQDHTFRWAREHGTIQVPETKAQTVAADNGEMEKPISRLTAKEAREELARRGIEAPEKATKAELIALLGGVADDDEKPEDPAE